jgi:hypothetical protein
MSLVLHLFWALANSIWQSAALAGLVHVAIRAMRGTTAALRYALWGAVLIACAVLPIVNLALPARTYMLPAARYAETESTRPHPVVPATVSHFESADPIRSIGSAASPQVDVAPVTPAWQVSAAWVQSNGIALALGAWALVTLLLLSRLALGYARLRTAKHALVYRELGTAERQASRRRSASRA